MKAALLYRKGDLRLDECETPVPGAGRLRVRACGVCGSDIPRLHAGQTL